MEKEVKVIVADEWHNAEHLLGTFLDESHYDVLVEEDCDFYAPTEVSLFGEENPESEEKCIFKFRKGYFSFEEQSSAYDGLIGAAGPSQNRGIAAGTREGMLLTREWVTDSQEEVLAWMVNPTSSLMGDPKEDLKVKIKADNRKISKGRVWLKGQVGQDFNFKEWALDNLERSEQEMIDRAKEIQKGISTTSFANEVCSGIAGWFDRYPRIPYGRATAYTENNPETFALAYPFLQKLSKGFSELLPERYGKQVEAANKIDSRYLVPKTPFTTITVNKSFRTAAHRDAGDLNEGFSNLSVITNKPYAYQGAYLVLPEFRVAVNIRPGDLLLINNHQGIHGNTPITLEQDGERMSVVCYFREKMLELGEKEYEDTRFQFVEDRRKNKDHPEWREKWNGVSPGMWASEEWYEYLKESMGEDKLYQYHPETKKSDDYEIGLL